MGDRQHERREPRDGRRTILTHALTKHVVHSALANGGGAFRMRACMNVTVRDGRIARLEEYLDGAHLKPLQTA